MWSILEKVGSSLDLIQKEKIGKVKKISDGIWNFPRMLYVTLDPDIFSTPEHWEVWALRCYLKIKLQI